MSASPLSPFAALALVISVATAAPVVAARPQVPSAGRDALVTLDEEFHLIGHVEGQSPLVFWMADGNDEFEDMLVRYHSTEGVTGVGPLRMGDGRGLGWPGDLVRIGERVHGVDVGLRQIYVVDLPTGRCLAVTPQLSGEWKMLQSLAYDPERDSLFAYDHINGQLLSIARGSGATTRLNAPGLNGRRAVRSLAFEPKLGLLFAVDSEAQLLIVVDPEQGYLAGTMELPIPEDTQIEELQFFEGELYGILGHLDQGELVAGQLLRINIKTGGISHVGPRIESVSPHALLIESVPERVSWRQTGGPRSAVLDYTSTVETRVFFSETGSYEFELTAYTGSGRRRDRVSVEVVARDCNANGVPDTDDLALGRALDRNSNGVLDECELERGYVARFEPSASAGWVGVRVVPRLGDEDPPAVEARAWLADAVLFRASPWPFAGPILTDARRCTPFDLRSVYPGMRRSGALALDGRMVGVELLFGLWHRDERAACATPGAPERDFRLTVSL